jgi:hypothetical protein
MLTPTHALSDNRRNQRQQRWKQGHEDRAFVANAVDVGRFADHQAAVVDARLHPADLIPQEGLLRKLVALFWTLVQYRAYAGRR